MTEKLKTSPSWDNFVSVLKVISEAEMTMLDKEYFEVFRKNGDYDSLESMFHRWRVLAGLEKEGEN